MSPFNLCTSQFCNSNLPRLHPTSHPRWAPYPYRATTKIITQQRKTNHPPTLSTTYTGTTSRTLFSSRHRPSTHPTSMRYQNAKTRRCPNPKCLEKGWRHCASSGGPPGTSGQRGIEAETFRPLGLHYRHWTLEGHKKGYACKRVGGIFAWGCWWTGFDLSWTLLS